MARASSDRVRSVAITVLYPIQLLYLFAYVPFFNAFHPNEVAIEIGDNTETLMFLISSLICPFTTVLFLKNGLINFLSSRKEDARQWINYVVIGTRQVGLVVNDDVLKKLVCIITVYMGGGDKGEFNKNIHAILRTNALSLTSIANNDIMIMELQSTLGNMHKSQFRPLIKIEVN
ncbi:hypothetical protein [Photobacterium damselae]